LMMMTMMIMLMCLAGCTTLTVNSRPSTKAQCSHVIRLLSTVAQYHLEHRSYACLHWSSVSGSSDSTGPTSDVV